MSALRHRAVQHAAEPKKGEPMMKRLTALAFVLFTCALPAFSLDLTVFGTDFRAFAQQLGNEMLPNLRSAALSSVGLESAGSDPFPRVSVSLSAGAVLSTGLFKFVDTYSFSLLDFNALANAALANSSTLTNLYSGMKSFFPYPVTRIGIGLGSVAGFDTQFQFAIFPEFLTDALTGAANVKGLKFNTFNAGLRLRRTLIPEQTAIPGVSVSFGYIYSNFNLSYDLAQAGTVTMSGTPMTFTGTLVAGSVIHSAGADFTVYKKFGVVKLSGGISMWEQITYYKGGIEGFDVSDGTPADNYKTNGGTDPLVDRTLSVLTTLVRGGVDFQFGGFDLFLHAQFDPVAGVPAANFGMGFGF